MKPNFDISLPSIPGRTIKFKIQDIKQTSFGSRKQRFQDNKRRLTKKFIESFNNFHETKDQSRLQQQTQASQTGSRISIKSNSTHSSRQNDKKFRHMIPEDKKHIISVYEKYKQYQQPILNENKFDKGYTFHKAAKQIMNIKDNNINQQYEDKWTKKFVTDNYYFTQTVIQTNQSQNDELLLLKPNKKQDIQSKKIYKPSAVFKNQTRQQTWDRMNKNQVPGPGFYIDQQKQLQTKTKQKISISNKQSTNGQNDYKKLKQIITSIVAQEKQQDNLQKDQSDQNKKQKMQHMFIKDDRDRFGLQKYPISAKVNVPGPGSYDIMRGIQDQARKVALVQQQRKLLKEWFNN